MSKQESKGSSHPGNNANSFLIEGKALKRVKKALRQEGLLVEGDQLVIEGLLSEDKRNSFATSETCHKVIILVMITVVWVWILVDGWRYIKRWTEDTPGAVNSTHSS